MPICIETTLCWSEMRCKQISWAAEEPAGFCKAGLSSLLLVLTLPLSATAVHSPVHCSSPYTKSGNSSGKDYLFILCLCCAGAGPCLGSRSPLLLAVITLPPVTKLGLEVILSIIQGFLIFQEIMLWLPPLCVPFCPPQDVCLGCWGQRPYLPQHCCNSSIFAPDSCGSFLEPFHSAAVPMTLLNLTISVHHLLELWLFPSHPCTACRSRAPVATSCLACKCSAEHCFLMLAKRSKRTCRLLNSLKLRNIELLSWKMQSFLMEAF